MQNTQLDKKRADKQMINKQKKSNVPERCDLLSALDSKVVTC